MNAKKIMGAVLVALLAAALFVGAGAAATYGVTVFVNEKLPAEEINGLTFVDEKGAVVEPLFDPLDDEFAYFPTAGVYTAEDEYDDKLIITVKSPEATISGVAGTGVSAYTFIPGTFYIETGAVVKINAAIPEFNAFLNGPNGEVALGDQDEYESELESILNGNPIVGEYSLSVKFPYTYFVNATSEDLLSTKPVTFTVAKAGEGTIAASVDQVLKGQPFTLTITGQPGAWYSVIYDEDDIYINPDQQALSGIETEDGADFGDDKEGLQFKMPNTGKLSISASGVAANVEKSETIELVYNPANEEDDNQGSVTVKFNNGAITDVKTDAKSYYIGAEAEITGLSTAGKIVSILIEGSNFEATLEADEDFEVEYGGNAVEQTFKITLKTGDLVNAYNKEGINLEGKKIDVGPYVLTLKSEAGAQAGAALLLTQPFISIVEAPEVVIQGEDAEFVINAEATNKIKYYIFGNNFFKYGGGVQDSEVKTQFTVTIDEKITENMSENQYFAVFQHPMYDGEYNITANGWMIETIEGVDLIDVKIRQSANAAQALCDALDAQGIDDIYVKASFFVVDADEATVIGEIPKEVAKGDKLVISGVDTTNEGATVTVEMLSTAFEAIPKEATNVAAFAQVVSTVIADDGTWEITIDTTDLNIDEYNVIVKVDGEQKKKAVTNVVKAADKPDTPVTPPADDKPGQDEPVAPETPGFGALAALAGLGAVAVLLLRRE